MSGIDRARLAQKLIDLGWTEDNNDMLTPPDKLFENKPVKFYVYEAEQLQDLLGECVTDD